MPEFDSYARIHICMNSNLSPISLQNFFRYSSINLGTFYIYLHTTVIRKYPVGNCHKIVSNELIPNFSLTLPSI